MSPTVHTPLPVAERWYESEAVDANLTLIHEPHVHELLQANIWHLRGRDRDLLVDSGLGVMPLRRAHPDLFQREPILVLTHAHLDHMGSAHEFPDRRAHPGEPYHAPIAGSLYGPRLRAELGLAEHLPDLLLHALPGPGYRVSDYRLRPAPITRWLAEGDTVDLGDTALTVLHLPGHSPGSSALFNDHDGTLFSGDVIYDDELLDDIVGANPEQYQASLRRLLEVPVSTVRPGHGASFGRDRLHAIVKNYLRDRTTRASSQSSQRRQPPRLGPPPPSQQGVSETSWVRPRRS